ncbi:MAG TPA: AI-2E family transporter [Burkholderiales bacterium]|jgi:predicted PurR-regulated permease PerM|nr:AI-2E family transporter [Burkholderiales bacterium]
MNRTTRTDQILGFGILFVLIAGCFLVLRPFLTDLLWAAVLAFSSWPVYTRLRDRLGGRRNLAALLVTAAMVLVVVGPFAIAANAIAQNADRLVQVAHRFFESALSGPPEWLARLPLIGTPLADYWRGLTEGGAAGLRELTPLARSALLAAGQAMGAGLLHLGLSVFLTFFLLRNGEAALARLMAVMERLAGARARRLIEVAGATVSSVVYGILGTALAQGLLAGIGFGIAGVPAAALLGLATFFLSIVPVGPPLVWMPAGIWLYVQGSPAWAVFVLVWGLVVVSGVDNVLKPMLISRGSHLPFVMVFLGVLGGAIAFGFIGVFLGPTLLAVGYRLLIEWTGGTRETSLAEGKPDRP